ncbi:MAG: hypothetical protein Q7R66_17730 [Undibacterium sp.]|nr:hypothetical protein [Undibacterium sp.]MDO8654015.1 hypothetical protein [Undibacterium sp.]
MDTAQWACLKAVEVELAVEVEVDLVCDLEIPLLALPFVQGRKWIRKVRV